MWKKRNLDEKTEWLVALAKEGGVSAARPKPMATACDCGVCLCIGEGGPCDHAQVVLAAKQHAYACTRTLAILRNAAVLLNFFKTK